MMPQTGAYTHLSRFWAVFLLLMVVHSPLWAQTRIAFWNVENFYDIYDDPQTDDDAFTPEGSRHWTWQRFEAKRDGIAKTIIDMGLPTVVGLAEIENQKVLEELCQASPLRRAKYGIVHYDSPDPRGIDCALLYRTDSATLTESHAISISDSSFRKRDILLVGLALHDNDTIYCLINHWPSKLGGAVAAERRAQIAVRLSVLMDSLTLAHPTALVLAVGDFNTTAQELAILLEGSNLHSLTVTLADDIGTYNYQGVWQRLDHLLTIPSPHLGSLRGAIFDADYLLEDDPKHLCRKPFRTYLGPRYHGGISDHLPIYVDWRR